MPIAMWLDCGFLGGAAWQALWEKCPWRMESNDQDILKNTRMFVHIEALYRLGSVGTPSDELWGCPETRP